MVVLVPELDAVVARWRADLDPSAGWGVPAHVTLLYPFVAPGDLDADVLATVAGIAAASHPFTARFTELRWFDEQVVWAAPDPAAPFARLTTGLVAAFPDQPPYGGAIAEPIPHLTVGDGGDPDAMQAAAAVRADLPVDVEVSSVALLTGTSAPDAWSTVATFALRTAVC